MPLFLLPSIALGGEIIVLWSRWVDLRLCGYEAL